MSSAANAGAKAAGLEALHRLKSTDPPLYLTPSTELSKAARLASECLFASLNSYVPKNLLNQLYTDGFDAEQIWQQIDLQSQPLLSSLRRHVRYFEKDPSEIEKQFNLGRNSEKKEILREIDGVESESEDFADDIDDDEEDEDDEDEDEDEEEGEEVEDDEDDEESEDEEGENANGVEDKFLKIKELEKYLKEDEAREYGVGKEKKNKRKRSKIADEDENEDDDEDEDDELGLEDDDENGNDIRYEDFFTSNKKTSLKKKSKYDDDDDEDDDESDDMDMDEREKDDSNQNQQRISIQEKDVGELRAKVEEMEKASMHGKTKQSLSSHEKELETLRAEIEEMEKANMEPKTWTMQGEVTAAKRPQNSALEVDLDFEQNVRPPPLTTEKETATLEELIMKRITEGQFDDVQRPPTLSNKAPKEKKELDENKSKKGLAELYEDEYAQKTGLVSTALSFSDEQKKEASMLFKKLCVKFDALSHFHFAPKPVIEDMSIKPNVPALAIEEVAPLAVSDAAMLAPEEVFSGKGDIKEETELSKADRKRRRAKKKRKFKAESDKRMGYMTQQNTLVKPDNGNGES